MITKTITITALDIDYVIESLELNDTINLLDMIEDLSDVIYELDNSKTKNPGLIATVARTQRLLIDLCRLSKTQRYE